MTDNERDVHFQNAAKVLYVRIYQRIEHDYGPMHHLIPKVQEAVELLLAQYSYDLVLHAFTDIDYRVEYVPDLTEWTPTEQER